MWSPFGQGGVVLEDDVRHVPEIYAEPDFSLDEPFGAVQSLLGIQDLLLIPMRL